MLNSAKASSPTWPSQAPLDTKKPALNSHPEGGQHISFPTHWVSRGVSKASSLSPETMAPATGFVAGISLLFDPRFFAGRETGLELTNKFWCAKNVLKFNSIFYFVSQAKVNQLDVWNGNILV